MSKPSCDCCGLAAELYKTACKHMTICLSCRAKEQLKCRDCDTIISGPLTPEGVADIAPGSDYALTEEVDGFVAYSIASWVQKSSQLSVDQPETIMKKKRKREEEESAENFGYISAEEDSDTDKGVDWDFTETFSDDDVGVQEEHKYPSTDSMVEARELLLQETLVNADGGQVASSRFEEEMEDLSRQGM